MICINFIEHLPPRSLSRIQAKTVPYVQQLTFHLRKNRERMSKVVNALFIISRFASTSMDPGFMPVNNFSETTSCSSILHTIQLKPACPPISIQTCLWPVPAEMEMNYNNFIPTTFSGPPKLYKGALKAETKIIFS